MLLEERVFALFRSGQCLRCPDIYSALPDDKPPSIRIVLQKLKRKGRVSHTTAEGYSLTIEGEAVQAEAEPQPTHRFVWRPVRITGIQVSGWKERSRA